MNNKAAKFLFRYLTEGERCPTCREKLTVEAGTINEKSAWIIRCKRDHVWQVLVEFKELTANKPAEVTPASG